MKTTFQRLQFLIAAIEAQSASIEAVQQAAEAAKVLKLKHRDEYLNALMHDLDYPMELELAIYAEEEAKGAQQEASAYMADMLAAAKYHSEGVVAERCMQ